MSKRTSPLKVIASYFVLAFAVALIPFGLPAVLAGVLSLPFLAFIALVVTLGFNCFMWLGHRLFFAAFYGDDEEYKRFREAGGDPWFHLNNPFVAKTNCRFPAASSPSKAGNAQSVGAETREFEAKCHACGFVGRWHCGLCDAVLDDKYAPCPACGNDPFGERGTR